MYSMTSLARSDDFGEFVVGYMQFRATRVYNLNNTMQTGTARNLSDHSKFYRKQRKAK